jgi:hypothetical protein
MLQVLGQHGVQARSFEALAMAGEVLDPKIGTMQVVVPAWLPANLSDCSGTKRRDLTCASVYRIVTELGGYVTMDSEAPTIPSAEASDTRSRD